MKLLIIGGTRFVGHHLVHAAMARNHEVTLFNRGKQETSLPGDVETIHGDRNRDLDKLRGRRWDAVIDTCGYVPRSVELAMAALSDSVDRYVYISSISAYADVSTPGVDEGAPLATLTDEQVEKANQVDASGQPSAMIYGEMYGGLKALCERAAEAAMPNRVLVVRPGLIVGPRDYTDRLTYWPVRVARGGEVLAPGRPDRPLQFIDARDLGEWIVRMIEGRKTGIYNANSPAGSITMGSVLAACNELSANAASFAWVRDDFLLQEKVGPWMEMPLWLPESPDSAGFMSVSCAKAASAGLTCRPVKDTLADILDWHRNERPAGELKAGIAPEKEKAVLRRWHGSAHSDH